MPSQGGEGRGCFYCHFSKCVSIAHAAGETIKKYPFAGMGSGSQCGSVLLTRGIMAGDGDMKVANANSSSSNSQWATMSSTRKAFMGIGVVGGEGTNFYANKKGKFILNTLFS